MVFRTNAWTWAERLGALAVALVVVATVIPDVAGDGARGVVIATAYSAAAIGLVACIAVGQRRSRVLRIAGWALLLALALLELRLLSW